MVVPAVVLSDCVARDNGRGAAWALGEFQGKPLTLKLEITRVLQHATLQVSIWGSSGRDAWTRLTAFPPKSYCGTYGLELNPPQEVKYLRAQWVMGRWTATDDAPVFGFNVMMEEAHAKAAAAGAA